MSKFKITWPSGLADEFEQSDASTVEQFANIHFGSSWETAKESGVTVELLTEPADENNAPTGDEQSKSEGDEQSKSEGDEQSKSEGDEKTA